MRRVAFGAAFVGAAVLGARLIMPRLHARMVAACTRMFEQTPEDFPPRRMLAGIEETRVNTARALALLERGERDAGHATSTTGRRAAEDLGKEEEHLAPVGARPAEYDLTPSG